MALPCCTASRITQEIHLLRCGCPHRYHHCAPRTAAALPHAVTTTAAHYTDSSRRDLLLRLASIVAAASWQQPVLASQGAACSAAVQSVALPPLLSVQTDYDRCRHVRMSPSAMLHRNVRPQPAWEGYASMPHHQHCCCCTQSERTRWVILACNIAHLKPSSSLEGAVYSRLTQ